MITKRERELKAAKYIYYRRGDTLTEAKETAARLRRNGFYATVLREQRNGIEYYSIWSKCKREA